MYELKWNSDHPGHVVFLLDLSGSMADDNKINYVIDAVQDSVENLLTHCRNDKGTAKRVSVSVYGYNYHIVELWKNYDVRQMAGAMLDAEEAGKKIFDPQGNAKPEYQTCMRLAFEKAKKDVEAWIQSQQGKTDIPSPIVINVTDGYPYEGEEYNQEQVYADTLKAAQELMHISTPDGYVRLLNIHHDPKTNTANVKFPCAMPTQGDNVRFLFQASSPLTAQMAIAANNMGFAEAREGSRAMISNETQPSIITQFLNWGSSQELKPIPTPRPDAY